ncbi:MAG: helicase-related protein [bacterium]
MLQPRRVAARMVAARMAAERGEPVGATVGWHIRFERRVGPTTRIEVITEGSLTRRLQADPLLEGVSVVILDELHERSQHADLAVALLAEIRREVRPDLRLVAMSATLDPGPVAAFLDAAVVEAAGRTYPVEITYESRVDDRPLPLRCAAGVRRALREAPAGHVLAFLPGVADIERTAQALGELDDVEVLPLHGRLPAEAQDRALAPGGPRRVVLATNVAETSVTLDGVAAVVDTGLAHQPVFDPAAGLTRLLRRPISRASADQRAGRAGRTGPGRCHRLWTQGEHTARPADDVPELLRADLTRVALEIRAGGPIRPPSAGSPPRRRPGPRPRTSCACWGRGGRPDGRGPGPAGAPRRAAPGPRRPGRPRRWLPVPPPPPLR